MPPTKDSSSPEVDAPLAPLPLSELPSVSSPPIAPPLSSLLSSTPSIVYPFSSSSLSALPPLVPCAVKGARKCEGFACRTCSVVRKCPNRPSPGVRGRKAPWFLHWRQQTQSVHWLQEFQQLQDWLDGPSVEQVECQVQLQHRSTWQGACPADLPVELVLETPVGLLPFMFLPPDGWADVLDNNTLPAISQASQVRLEIRDPNLHWESTPAVPTHVPLLATLPHHHLQGYE